MINPLYLQIHLGRGITLSLEAYSLCISQVSSERQVVGNLAVALYGTDKLIKSTISGKGSNRNKGQIQPEEQLDSTKLLAIRGIVRTVFFFRNVVIHRNLIWSFVITVIFFYFLFRYLFSLSAERVSNWKKRRRYPSDGDQRVDIEKNCKLEGQTKG